MKKKSSALKEAKRNLHLVMAESAITASLMSMSVMTPFFNSIGLNNEQISLSQIIFTVVVIVLNIPTGYLADRVSRKWANIIGDFAHGLILLSYAFTNNIIGVIICESLAGVASALSLGVDQSLLKHFSDKFANATNQSRMSVLKSKTAKLECAKHICTFIMLALGGPIGAISLRLAIALSSVPRFIGGVISIFIQDDSEKLIPTHKNPLKDMARIAKSAFGVKPLRWRIFAYAVGREMTHGIIWVVTPLFMQAGVPLELVSFAWAFNSLMAVFGAHLASKFSHRLNDQQIFIVPMALMFVGMFTMGISLNIVTVWLYGLMGITQGWTAGTLSPMVQKYAKPSEQTSVLSLTKVVADLLYIPAVWVIGLVADIQLNYSLFATIVIFLPLGILIIKKLKQHV